MSKFSYWEAEDTAQHEYAGSEAISVEEAQVLATLKVADNLARVASTLDEIFRVLNEHSIDVNIKDMPN